MASNEISEFLSGPLVTWFISCLEDPNSLTNYDDLIDGVLLHNVFLQIEPEPLHDGVLPSGGETRVREKNLEIIVENIRCFYEDQLGHLLLTVPDTTKLGKEPEKNVPEAKLLLQLLLGCAVQSASKEEFITRIKTLHVDTQLAIVDCIKQVTDYQGIVVTQESMENANLGNVFIKLKKLLQEKNIHLAQLRNSKGSADGEESNVCTANTANVSDRSMSSSALSPERGDMTAPSKCSFLSSSMANRLDRLFSPSSGNCRDANAAREEYHRFAVEVADWKSKVRKQRQELEEKTESLIECKEELEHNRMMLQKLQEEKQELLLEARSAKTYRDELDAAIERAEQADRLEAEVARYREKLTDIEYYKSRIEELREDNRVLLETREMMEEQLDAAHKRSERVLELESEVVKYKQSLNDLKLEQIAEKDKCKALMDENAQLQRLIKSVASNFKNHTDLEPSNVEVVDDNRLSDQLSNNAHARALKLELENRRLTNIIKQLNEESFHEQSGKVLELEKEKKQLSLKIDSLNESSERLAEQNKELEAICKQSLEENKKLQACLGNQRNQLESRQQDIESLQTRLAEIERSREEVLSQERTRHQTLLGSVERRAEEAERSLVSAEAEQRSLRAAHDDLNQRLNSAERERDAAQREIQRLRELVERKDVALDEAGNTVEMLEQQLDEQRQRAGQTAAQITRLREIERSSRELDSRAAIDREALESLQADLVAEKLRMQRLLTTLEALGLEEQLLLEQPAEHVLQRVAELPAVVARASPPPAINETTESELQELREQRARLQVQVSRLESEITSLVAQQATLQQDRAELESRAERRDLELAALRHTHEELERDQQKLQTLHEQLSTEYEGLSREKDALKVALRDARNEARVLKEQLERAEARTIVLQGERDQSNVSAKSLSNLRHEHSKLKEDFRNLYASAEGVNVQYRALHDDYRKVKLENNRLSLRLTEMQGQFGAQNDRIASLELENVTLKQRCEALRQSNSDLDNDRKGLLEHMNTLFNQYQDLLSRSLEDKEHYHMEEKLYTDKVNHLHRQKEKLEEKIMEHYRKLDSCSTKKKSLGANLVRKVRRASSGLFGSPRPNTDMSASWPASESLLSVDGDTDSVNRREDEAEDERERDDEGEREESSSSTEDDPLSLNHPGTRRTVYYNDASSPSFGEQPAPEPSEQPSTYLPAEPRPVLIYNKVSAVINDSTNTTTARSLSPKDDPKSHPDNNLLNTSNDKDHRPANSVWYEYGCV